MDQWFAGNFERCLDLCDENTNPAPDIVRQIALLRARALLRLNRAAQALSVLDSVAWPENGDVTITARMLTGAALVRSNEVARGLALLETLQENAAGAHRTIQSEIALNRALAHFCRQEVDAADRVLNLVSTDADIIYARALEYRGWVACRRAKFALAIGYFREALEFLDTCKHYDRYLEANCAHVLGSLSVELLDQQTWAVVAERRAKIDWSAQDIKRHRYWLAICASNYAFEIEGADYRAVREARIAESLAPTPAALVEGLCQRAASAGRAHERLGQMDFADAAYELFCSLDPKGFEEYDKLVPLVLADELSRAGRVEQARQIFTAYREQAETSPLLAVTGNPTRYAFERLVEGFIAEAAEEQSSARRCYLDAFTRFRSVSYKRRAVHSALRLGALLNNAELFGYADAVTRHLPSRSWLRQQVTNLPTDIIVRGLSPARRDVLQLLCRGFTIPEIAAARNRSRKTIANTVTEVYRSFNVRHRTELLNELLRRGIIKSA
jgi:DNA-binding CsgD family transcriptional regulator/tetratricopeptide (TPR) repeat protein